MPRVVVIGLDACPPRLLFDAFSGQLPHLEALASESLVGPMESSAPPITVPAWTSMVTGVDPGTLGIYGFHDRVDRSYDRRRLASSLHVAVPPVWTILSRAGLTCRLIGVPQTYPAKPVRGALVSGPPIPARPAGYTYPPELQAEVEALAGGYIADLPEFRRLERSGLFDAILTMTARRFRLARAWLGRDDWQFFMMVEMGPDRLQHAFWREELLEPAAVRGARANPLRDYYVALDRQVGSLLEVLRPDDVVLVVSDHGAQALRGCFAINDWLVREGFLVLHEAPRAPTPIGAAAVDWARTRAWADGGYCGRIYVNVAGREPEGIVRDGAVSSICHELSQRLHALCAEDGERVPVTVLEPAQVYRALAGVPPELMLYVDDLAYRVIASVGHPGVWVVDNDRGPDGANHARAGVLVLKDGRGPRPAASDLDLYDVAPTILDRLGIKPPANMRGRILG
jgi:predicted AlkP superfamily phosphohydrolase/phosphomutase